MIHQPINPTCATTFEAGNSSWRSLHRLCCYYYCTVELLLLSVQVCQPTIVRRVIHPMLLVHEVLPRNWVLPSQRVVARVDDQVTPRTPS